MRQFGATQPGHSVVGPLALQPDGEPVANPVTYVRVEHCSSRQDILLSVEGAKIMGVITPPARLIGADTPVEDAAPGP